MNDKTALKWADAAITDTMRLKIMEPAHKTLAKIIKKAAHEETKRLRLWKQKAVLQLAIDRDIHTSLGCTSTAKAIDDLLNDSDEDDRTSCPECGFDDINTELEQEVKKADEDLRKRMVHLACGGRWRNK